MTTDNLFDILLILAVLLGSFYLYSLFAHTSKLVKGKNIDLEHDRSRLDSNANYETSSNLEGGSLLDKQDKIADIFSTEDKSNQNFSICSINYEIVGLNENEPADDESVKEYFDTLISYVRDTKETLYVLDYLEHGNVMNQNNNLSDIIQDYNRKYFAEIEKLVMENSNIKYKRILQIPINSSLSSSSKDHITKYAVERLYIPTHDHINALMGLDNFELYIFTAAVRSNSELIIDGKYWLLETDLYDFEKRAKPDNLFVHRFDESLRMKKAIAREQKLIQLTTRDKEPIKKDYLKHVIQDMENDLRIRKFQAEEQRKELMREVKNLRKKQRMLAQETDGFIEVQKSYNALN